ncbi:hypothetical protein, partial [Methylobacterium sp. E-045]|uniref:hypothetical protein n=1 Tax=Methylobacterium sp. E-045 TaxID=2836575 RepID=UPI001FBBB5AB
PLRRELPTLHQDGSIKFRIVLKQARSEKRILAELIAKRRIAGYPDRASFIRAAMGPVREKIAQDRAFWAVANAPTSTVEMRRVDYFGRAWTEHVVTGSVAKPREAA